MRKNLYRLDDTEGYVPFYNEYEQRSYVSFDRQKKEMTVFGVDGQKTYGIGELLIHFVTLDEQCFSLYEEDRRELIQEIDRIDSYIFQWDYSDVLSELLENYLEFHNISKDEFAKKYVIYELVTRHEKMHPYLKMLDLYTSILPFDNDELLKETLNLQALQHKAIEILEFCFDVDSEYLNNLSSDKRYYFYAASGRGSIPQNFKTRVISLPDRIHFDNYNIFYKGEPYDFSEKKIWELSSLQELKIPQDVSEETINFLKNAETQIYETYEINCFADIIYLEIYQMLLNRSTVKKCEMCGRYFIIKGDYNAKYCDRKVTCKRQTCQQIGSSRDFNKRVEKSEPQKEYMKAYKRMHSRIKYGMITKEKFHEWNNQANGKLLICEDGDLALVDFKLWLGNK